MTEKRQRGRPSEGRDHCVATNLSLDPEVREQAKVLAKESGISLSLWVERLIRIRTGVLSTGMFLLDTSAIKKIPKRILEKAASLCDIAYSPVSFFELMSHLDEGDEKSFIRARGNVLKCEFPRVLPDPFADHAIRSGVQSIMNPTREEDEIMVPKLLSLLRASENKSEFTRGRITYPNGAVSTIKNIGERTESVLVDLEDQYREVYDAAISNLRDLDKEITDDVIGDAGAAMCGHLARSYAEDLGVDPKTLYERVSRSAFFHHGYTVVRAATALEKEVKNGGLPNHDRNDAEDAAILFHLDLVDENILVTADKGLAESVKRVVRIYNERLGGLENYESRVEVLDAESFMGLVEKKAARDSH